VLYYLKVHTDACTLYKVGITNRTVQTRFTLSDLKLIEVIWVKTFSIGEDAHREESLILQKFAHLRYKGEPVLTSGNTELFTEDVLAGYQGVNLV
jgi:hypothetical protein